MTILIIKKKTQQNIPCNYLEIKDLGYSFCINSHLSTFGMSITIFYIYIQIYKCMLSNLVIFLCVKYSEIIFIYLKWN